MAYFPPTGSVVAFQSDPTKLVGTVSVVGNVGQIGTRITSIVSTVPSSVIVGASIFGTVPVTQVTNPWVVGSVVTTTPGTPFRFSTSLVSGSVTLIAASVASQRHYITDFTFFNTGSVATLITFQDGSASIVAFTGAPPTSGSNKTWVTKPRTNPSQDLAFKVGTSNSILYATINGYTE